MIRTVLCAALALGSVAILSAADAFIGTWKMDLAQSTFATDYTAAQELTLTLTEAGGTLTEIRQRTEADGSTSSTSWTAPLTGGTVTFPAGQGPNGGAALAVIGDRTLVMKQTLRNARAGASRTYQVSGDGQTLTLTQIREDGKEMARMVLIRQ